MSFSLKVPGECELENYRTFCVWIVKKIDKSSASAMDLSVLNYFMESISMMEIPERHRVICYDNLFMGYATHKWGASVGSVSKRLKV